MTRRRLRWGQVHVAWLAFLASAGLLVGLVALLMWNPGRYASSTEPLVVYCAAGIKAPVEAAAQAYEKEYGVPVQLQYGGSQTLLANIEVAQKGDLYLPADDSYVDLARQKGLLAETIPLAEMKPVLVVRRGNPHKVVSLAELLKTNLRVCQANPDAAAVGKLTQEALLKTGQWDALKKRTIVFKPTVNDVANDIKVGAVDAGIVWDATASQYPELEVIDAPELAAKPARISIGVLRNTTQPTAALRFARYLAAGDRGLPEFKKQGFKPVDGDDWALEPEIKMLAGSMLRPAIDDTIKDFEEREGVHVTRVYNGCGILVAQMQAGQKPDAYFACDKSFLDQVNDIFIDAVDVSTNQLVILVPKGNPRQIKSMEDLGNPGLRIGIGHEKQCAMGALTQTTLKAGKVQNKVMKNVVVQSPTGDLLVNQMRAKSLDAAIAYVSNAKTAEHELDWIPIDIPCAIAVQPVAVGKESKQKHLTQRLLDRLRSAESRHQFEKSGFHWQQKAESK
ncbi:MAG: molybdate ABC transporter substrate-binding protein [Gemmataceae bacterium]|nr:molybdate ABC transporter substrate-binding protein [Gemmataceae bacterium]